MCCLCNHADFNENGLNISVTDIGSEYEVQLNHVCYPLSYNIGTYSKDEFQSKDSVMEVAIKEDCFECACAIFVKMCQIFDIVTTDDCDCVLS